MTVNTELALGTASQETVLPEAAAPGMLDPVQEAEAVIADTPVKPPFDVPFEKWAEGVFKRVREESARKQAEQRARRLARITTDYCMICGSYDKLPDGIMDQYCIDNPPEPRGEGLPRWSLAGPTIL